MKKLILLLSVVLLPSFASAQNLDAETQRTIRETRMAIAGTSDPCVKGKKYYAIGAAYAERFQYALAIAEYKEAEANLRGRLCLDAAELAEVDIDPATLKAGDSPLAVSASLQLGLAYYELKDWPNTIEWLSKYLTFEEDEDAFHKRGHAYLATSNPTAAAKDFTKALEDSRGEHLYLDRARAYVGAGQFELAIADCTKMIEYNPESANAYYFRGLAKAKNTKQPDLAGAILDFAKAIDIMPKHAEALFERASAYMRLKDYDRAMTDLDATIRLAPDAVNAYLNRGLIYSARSEWEKASVEFTKAIALDAKDAYAFRLRGESFYELRKTGEALADFDRATMLSPAGQDGKQSYVKKGFLLMILERYSDAATAFSKSIELEGTSVNYGMRGEANFKLGKFDAAIADLDKSVALGARPAAAAQTKAKIYFVQDKYVLALAQINIAIKDEASAENLELRASIYCVTGKKLLANADERKIAALGGKVAEPCK